MRKLRLIVGLFSLLVLTGCESHNLGFAPRVAPEITGKAEDPLLKDTGAGANKITWLDAYHNGLGKCSDHTTLPVGGKCANNGLAYSDWAMSYRNSYIDAIRAKIDDHYRGFKEDVHSGNAVFGMASDWAIIGLSGAGSVVADVGLKSILAVASGGMAGANASYQKQVLNQQTSLAIIAAMDAARGKEAVILVQDESQSITKCTLEAALVDLRDYYEAGTLAGGLTYLQGQMQTQTQNSQNQAQTIKTGGLAVSPQTLPDGTVSTVYPSTIITATGGTAPYTWSIATGVLPPGLTPSSSASGYLISGTPTSKATYPFTLLVTDSSPTKETATASFTITVQ